MNVISISGEIVSDPVFSHRCHRERFFEFYVSVIRISGTPDVLRCVASELMLEKIVTGKMIRIDGEIRTRNQGKHLIVYVFADSIEDSCYSDNHVELRGYICKKPSIKESFSGRNICEFFIAHNRIHGNSDYIPCISWGRNAFRTEKIAVGTEVEVVGRLQSREYMKKLENGEKETRTAYELSVSELCVWESEDEQSNDV